jgi:hypothetical protein
MLGFYAISEAAISESGDSNQGFIPQITVNGLFSETPRPGRITNLRTEVIREDPDWIRDSNEVIENEFPGAKDGQPRKFTGYYKVRGPYAA